MGRLGGIPDGARHLRDALALALDGCENSIFRARHRPLIGDERRAFDAAKRTWMTARDRCGADTTCIRAQFDTRLRVLHPDRASACAKQLAAAPAPAPTPKAGIVHPAAGCAAGVAVHGTARQVRVTGPEPGAVAHGGAIAVNWSLPAAAQSGMAQVYLIGAMPEGVRFAREKRPEKAAQAGFFVLPAAARAPYDIAFGAGKTRVLIAINDADGRAGASCGSSHTSPNRSRWNGRWWPQDPVARPSCRCLSPRSAPTPFRSAGRRWLSRISSRPIRAA
jgi:hypothetical protein